MEGQYCYSLKEIEKNRFKFGISKIEGMIENPKEFVTSIELLNFPEKKIILIENPYVPFLFRGSSEKYLMNVISRMSDNFKEGGIYEEYLGLMEGESPREKKWLDFYRKNGWKHFSERYPYWIVKGNDMNKKERLKLAENTIKDLFKLL